MYFDSYKSLLYSDTLIPDIFITEYMPSMECDYIKIYIYCVFLSKHNKHAAIEELSKKLGIGMDNVKSALTYMEEIGIIKRKENSITLIDLKEKEINKIYRMKSTSTPEEAALSSDRNKKRNKIISAINKTFFQGLMSPSWYTDVDAWFDKYQFDEDVMYTLFQHCYDHKGLSKNYIVKVADNWQNKNIRNSFDVDGYFTKYQKLKEIKSSISKKLNLNRNLTEYEEEFVEKWIIDYNFSFEIIELSLKKTTSKTNPHFKYIDAILTDWYQQGLKTKEEIGAYEKNRKPASAKKQAKGQSVPQQGNFEQRKYDDDYFNNLYINVGDGK